MKVKLPELPPIGVNSYGYGGYEMEAYGRACYLAALADAARVCDGVAAQYNIGRGGHSAERAAAAIRALGESK